MIFISLLAGAAQRRGVVFIRDTHQLTYAFFNMPSRLYNKSLIIKRGGKA